MYVIHYNIILISSQKEAGPACKEIYENIRDMMAQNYKAYREKLKLANPPVIPHLGMWLTDLTVSFF
jgi:hypothetical protein